MANIIVMPMREEYRTASALRLVNCVVWRFSKRIGRMEAGGYKDLFFSWFLKRIRAST